MKGDNIQYISLIQSTGTHCRVIALQRQKIGVENILYDKEKYLQLLLHAAETVLGYFGFDSAPIAEELFAL
jgi:hypothetical protein